MGRATGKNNTDLGVLHLLQGLIGTIGSAGRGLVAGTAGLPGDIESLVRMLPGLSEKTILPTTDEVSNVLPNLPLRYRQPVAEGLGQMGAMTPGQVVKLGRAVKQGALSLMGRVMSPPRATSQAGAVNPGSIFDYLLPEGNPSSFSNKVPRLDPVQLEALKLYTDNSALFQPVRIPQQKAALQHALAKKQITQGQMENIDNLRLALDEALLQDLHLPGPIYRGLRDFDQAPKMGDILGGYHPASFSYDPDLVMKEFMGNFATDNAMIQIPRNHTVQGLVVPKHAFGPAGDESEVLLHPNTRLLMNKVDDSDYGKVMTSKPTFDTDGPEYDIGGWKDGGLIKEPKWEQLEGGYLLR